MTSGQIDRAWIRLTASQHVRAEEALNDARSSQRSDQPYGSSGCGAPAAETLPTVRDVLALDAVAQGVPEVLVGGDALDARRALAARVRQLRASRRLLDGGELLLSTGSAWPAEPAELRRFIGELADADVAGVVLELGTHYRYVPRVVADTAAERGLALIVLHREVKFVTLTEAVHSRIIAGQTGALRSRDEVRERFTALVLRGSPADFIVHQLAQTLGAPGHPREPRA